jgi:hypothetical protein
MTSPYAFPDHLPADLARVDAYWTGLLRGNAKMPFWDDVKLTDLPDLVDRLFLIDVFDAPERFRFNSIGKAIEGGGEAGRFLDEVDLTGPFAFLRSQCSATVEAAGATFFRQAAPPSKTSACSRLLLPMWGDGRIGMLLGALKFG